MNEYYQTKASLPRQEKHSVTLTEALENWRDHRLLHVASLCSELNDPFRTEFGKVHLEFAQAVNLILEDERNIPAAIFNWFTELKTHFNSTQAFNKGGGRRGGLGICGAELEQIINLGLQ